MEMFRKKTSTVNGREGKHNELRDVRAPQSDGGNTAKSTTTASDSRSELSIAVAEFQKNYECYISKNRQYTTIKDEDIVAAQNESEANPTLSAETFSKQIVAVLEGLKTKKDFSTQSEWTKNLGQFLKGVYPLAKICLGIAGSLSQVAPTGLPLKAITNGVGVILQLVDKEMNRSKEFHCRLKQVGFQVDRVANRVNVDTLTANSTRDQFHQKSDELMIMIIYLFNSYLQHFNQGFFEKTGKSLVGMVDVDDRWNGFQESVKEYDQLISDLSFHTVAKVHDAQVKQNDPGFVEWLAPLHMRVEEQLLRVRGRRNPGTLGWAQNVLEFQNWRSHTKGGSSDRILWIRGFPGVGKSTLAGYYIDLLEESYPKSVLYFFCVRGVHGLMKVHDIIRSLAYQLSMVDETANSALESLKAAKSPLDQMGIHLLFHKLLQSFLSNMKRDIYIVVDGLDEADTETRDTKNGSDGYAEAELDIFLRALGNLASTRLLFISRPDLKVSAILSTQNPAVKTIDVFENKEDIKEYVTNFLANSKRLQNFFDMEKVEPVSYFLEKANGVFLWVALSLPRLERQQTRSDFTKELRSLSEASGSMEKLYQNILMRVDEKSKAWITKTLRWVVGARRLLTITELRDILESSFEDTLGDFQHFIEINCGSMLQILTTEDGGKSKVQLIHETFRSFLLNRAECRPTYYYIDELESDGFITRECLNHFSSHAVCSNRYIARYWMKHLMDINTTKNDVNELCIRLHQFVTSEGLRSWIRTHIQITERPPKLAHVHPFSSRGSSPFFSSSPYRRISIVLLRKSVKSEVQRCLMPLEQWIASIQSPLTSSILRRVGLSRSPISLLRSKAKDERLYQYVGRIAGNMWVHREFVNFYEDRALFYFALVLSLKSREYSRSKVKSLYERKFLHSWTTDSGHRKTRNIGAGYFFLGQWDDCVQCFDATLDSPETSFEKCLFRGMAYQEKGDLEKSIQALTTAVEIDPSSEISWLKLGEAYQKKGDVSGATDVYERAFKSVRLYRGLLKLAYKQRLSLSLRPKNNYDGSIEVLNLLIDKLPGQSGKGYPDDAGLQRWEGWLWNTLGDAYITWGQLDKALQVYITLTRIPSKVCYVDPYREICGICKEMGNYEPAIELLSSATEESPRLVFLLGIHYKARGDTSNAMKMFAKVVTLYEKTITLVDERPKKDFSLLSQVSHPECYCAKCRDTPVKGMRYKCITCDYHDLCETCMSRTPHPHGDHEFITIPSKKYIIEKFGVTESLKYYPQSEQTSDNLAELAER